MNATKPQVKLQASFPLSDDCGFFFFNECRDRDQSIRERKFHGFARQDSWYMFSNQATHGAWELSSTAQVITSAWVITFCQPQSRATVHKHCWHPLLPMPGAVLTSMATPARSCMHLRRKKEFECRALFWKITQWKIPQKIYKSGTCT